MNPFVLVNPKARGGKLEAEWPDLEPQVFSALGTREAEVAFTSLEDHGSGLVRQALKTGAKKIVVVGGDGTLSEAVQGFFEKGKPIAPDASLLIVPAGRGDDFFKAVIGKRPSSSRQAWELALGMIREGQPMPIDLGEIRFSGSLVGSEPRYFINVTSFGFPGLVVQRVLTHAGVFGKTPLAKSTYTYLVQSGLAMLEYKPVEVSVRVDGEMLYQGKIWGGFVMNGSYNAGGVRWCDDSAIDDSIFNILVMEPRGLLDTVRGAQRMLTGRWADAPGAHVASGRKIEISLKPGLTKPHPLFDVDGDQPEQPDTRSAVIQVLPKAINLWR